MPLACISKNNHSYLTLLKFDGKDAFMTVELGGSRGDIKRGIIRGRLKIQKQVINYAIGLLGLIILIQD